MENTIRSQNPPPEISPTTFVQADTTNFKQVVQFLTGSSSSSSSSSSDATTTKQPLTTKNFIPPKKQSFKLYERRSTNNKNFIINTLSCFSNHSNSRKAEILSPSILDFPKLTLLSPVTPLIEDGDPFNKYSPSLGSCSSEEEKAIAEKGFYFHPSPLSTPRIDGEPLLLPLFPVTSPRVSGR